MNQPARDLEAAQKTIAVLKGKVISLYNGNDESAVARQLKAAQAREEANRQRRELMELRQKELQSHSDRLEAEVAQRTREMRNILDHVTFGFLLLDENMKVAEGYTNSCNVLLEQEGALTGQSIIELLSPKSPLSYELSFGQLYEDIMPEEVSLGQLPQRFVMASGRALRVEPSVIRDQQGAVAQILLTISDVSALEAARRESDNNRILVSILKAKPAFLAFLHECKGQLRSAKDALLSGDQATARRALHTVKGNSASYDLQAVVSYVHEQEELETLTEASLEGTHEKLRAYLKANYDVLEIDYDDEAIERYQVSDAQVERLRQIVIEGGSESPALRRWTAELVQKPALELLGPIDDFVQRLATRLDKKVNFELKGGDTLVDVETVRPAFRLLSHMLRNALDHGIERAEARAPKPESGRLTLSLEATTKDYTICLEDDGRGVDGQRLADKAVASGRLTQQQADALDHEARLQLAFLDGLSSAEQTTDISGRGVGMSAVKSEIEAVYGTVSLSSKLGEGTQIRICIPKPELLQPTSIMPPSSLG